MATINTIQDLPRLLDENPEWVDALRARLLMRDLLELPERFAQFSTEMNTFVAEVTEFKATVERFIETTNLFIAATDRRFEENAAQHRHFDADMKVLRSDIGVLRGSHARTTAIRKAAGIARGMGLRRTRNLSSTLYIQAA